MLAWAVFQSAIASAKAWLANGNKLTDADIRQLEDMSFNATIIPLELRTLGLRQTVSFSVIRGLQQYSSSRVRELLGICQ